MRAKSSSNRIEGFAISKAQGDETTPCPVCLELFGIFPLSGKGTHSVIRPGKAQSDQIPVHAAQVSAQLLCLCARWRATALTWAQKDLTCQRAVSLGTAVQPPCFANTCERCSWTGRFVGLFPESTHHRENASVELRSISPRLSLMISPPYPDGKQCHTWVKFRRKSLP